jgi:hypothetical protein
MRKVIYISFIIFLLSRLVHGQETDSNWNPDKKTFELYTQKNWKELIFWSKKAIKEGHDYFYMRMRLGIALYETHNYQRALIHFRKAYEFNSKDPYLLQYLYYANLFAGRKKAALDISREFPSGFYQKIISRQVPKFKIATLGLQTVFSDLETGEDLVSGIDRDQYGSQLFLNNFTKINLGFNHTISRRFSMFYQYSLLIENRFFFYQDNSTAYYLPEQKLYESQIYLSGNIYLGSNFNLFASANYLPGSAPEISSGRGQSFFYAPGYRYNDFSGNLTVFKDFSYISLGLSATYSYLQLHNYTQEGIFIQFYPLGNLNLYLTGSYQLKQKSVSGQFSANGSFYEYKLGYRIFKPLWLEIEGTSGDLQYASTQLASMVYNNPNRVNNSFGGTFLIDLKNKNLWLKLSYYYSDVSSQFYSEDHLPTDVNTIHYNIHSIFGGLSWTF